MFLLDALKVWDLDAEYRHWCLVAAQQGCPAEQFAFRWVQMRRIYGLASDMRLPMEAAFQQFLLLSQEVEMSEEVARLVFGWTWARIVSQSQ